MAKTTKRKLIIKAKKREKITRIKAMLSKDRKKIQICIFSVKEEIEPVIAKAKLSETKKQPDRDFEQRFPIVDVEGISLKDRFLEHEPLTPMESRIKNSILYAKQHKMKNFRKPAYDPSFSDDRKTIVFEPEKKPAVGKTGEWWEAKFKSFMPEKNSRSMTRLEYDLFLAVIIKYLVDEEDYGIHAAWKAVCEDSKGIGHYYNSKNTNHKLEPTGSRAVGKFYDLGNTIKLIKADEGWGFWYAGSYFKRLGYVFPLANLRICYPNENYFKECVGCMVMDV